MKIQAVAFPLFVAVASCGGGGGKAGGSDASQTLDFQTLDSGASDTPGMPDGLVATGMLDAPSRSDVSGSTSIDVLPTDSHAVDGAFIEPEAAVGDGGFADHPGTGATDATADSIVGADTSPESTGQPTDTWEGTCVDLLGCIGNCPDADETCPDDCYARGSETGQSQLVALLTCMDQAGCGDVTCTQAACNIELTTCLDSGTTASGSPNPDGGVPAGSIPPDLVGRWTSPGSTEVTEFVFNADGTATHSNYKESGIGTCDMSVWTQWNTGSVIASGDHLTVTLAPGTTSVAWAGGCGTSYVNPAEGKILEYSYVLDLSGATPGLWLTDLSCTGSTCETFFRKS